MNLKNSLLFDKFKRRIRKVSRTAVGWHQVFSHERVKSFQAVLEGAYYADENMKGAFSSESKRDVLVYSLAQAPNEGLVAEFGVWSGQTINLIADTVGPSRTVHGFNSFEGLPEDWFGIYGKGAFNTGGKLPHVRSNVVLHKGWFEDSLPAFAKDNDDKIAFLHVDCDLYSSTKTIFEYFGDKIEIGDGDTF